MRFAAEYLVRTRSKELELDLVKMQNEKFISLSFGRRSKEDDFFQTYHLKLSFEADTQNEAKRIAALNTDCSLVVFKEDHRPIGHSLNLKELRLWQNKLLIQESYLSAS
jgi:hypothetical protein